LQIIASLLLFLAGAGCIAYSYIGAFLRLGDELSTAQTPGEAFFMVMAILNAIAGGAFPQLTGFLYSGLLLCVIAIVMLFFGKRRT
jgi:hypothetical protein